MTSEQASLRDSWRDGVATFGIWSCLPGVFPPELFGRLGAEYVCIDQQHGMHGPDDLPSLFQAVQLGGAQAFTRVGSSDPTVVTKALDAGADGIILPLVETAEQAAAFVDVSTYPPGGSRSFGAVRAPYLRADATPATLDQVCRVVMIETMKGVDNVDEIAATPGLDAIYIGPADLALSLGAALGQQHEDPRFVAVVERIKRACDAADIALGMHCTDGTMAASYAERGLTMLTVAADIGLLAESTARELTQART